MKDYQEIVKKYPRLFKTPDSRMPFAMFGFECSEGWYDLIDCLCGNINAHIKQHREGRARVLRFNRAMTRAQDGDLSGLRYYYRDYAPEWQEKNIAQDLKDLKLRPVYYRSLKYIHITQVKEKFGGLRFYYNGGDEEIAGMVRMAEDMSHRLCEVCGSPGRPSGKGWVRTLCETHKKD